MIKVDRSDSGVYYCSVNGDGFKTRNVSLLVEHGPDISSEDVYLQHPGYAVTLMCHVSAVPPPVITWYRYTTNQSQMEDVEILQSDDNVDIMISNFTDGKVTSSLHIETVSDGDFGHYICAANNAIGTVSHSKLYNMYFQF